MPAFLALHSTDNGLAGSPTESNVAVDSMQAISGWVDVLSQRSLSRAAQVIVEHLAHVTEARTVVLGRWNPVRETTDVLAISATKGWDPRSERLQQYRAAFDECLIRGQSTRWPGRDENDANSSLILQRLAEGVGCGSIDCLPLSEEGGRPHYMAIVLGNRVIGENSEPLIAAYAPLVSPALKLHQRAEGRGVRGIVDDCRSGFALRRNRLILVACVALLAGLFVPVPHTIRCDCVTQPVARRFVAAPFAGTLKTVHVQLGERVEPGQVLALMDGQEIELELAALAAELDRARSQRDGFLAVKDIVAAESARYEFDRLKIREKLLRHRRDTLAIRSPIAGLVIAGDLADSEGAPVSVGQGLFEVAPLDQLIVEAEIPESQIRYVRAGLPLEISTEAFPDRDWRQPLVQIHPQTEKRNDRFAFIGETVIENRDHALRPGMHGRAVIRAGMRPLGWCLFHRAWEHLRTGTGC